MDFTKTANILIVDDNPDHLQVLGRMLEKHGYTVRKTINGKFALQVIESIQPDLILLDINMPDITGYEVCQRLKSLRVTKNVPVIFLSAYSEAIDKVKGFQAGGVDYITKPFNQEEILVRIHTHLTLYLQQQQIISQQSQLIAQNTLLENIVRQEQRKTQELEVAIQELQQTQSLLLKATNPVNFPEFIESINREINNPMSCIYRNITTTKKYFQSIIDMLETCESRLLEADSDYHPSIVKN